MNAYSDPYYGLFQNVQKSNFSKLIINIAKLSKFSTKIIIKSKIKANKVIPAFNLLKNTLIMKLYKNKFLIIIQLNNF